MVTNVGPKISPAPGFTTTGGACMMDVTGSGNMDLVLMQAGAQAIRVLHNKGDGSYEEFDAAAAGLKARAMRWPAPWAITTAMG